MHATLLAVALVLTLPACESDPGGLGDQVLPRATSQVGERAPPNPRANPESGQARGSDGPRGSGGGDSATSQEELLALCGEAIIHLVECGIYAEGSTPCESLPPRIGGAERHEATCSMQCLVDMSCTDAEGFLCGGPQSPAADGCFATCSQEAESLPLGPEFECEDGFATVPARWVCDGEADCDDGSDEPGDCMPADFECPGGGTIPGSWVCDNLEDCADGSDESEELCGQEPELLCARGFGEAGTGGSGTPGSVPVPDPDSD